MTINGPINFLGNNFIQLHKYRHLPRHDPDVNGARGSTDRLPRSPAGSCFAAAATSCQRPDQPAERHHRYDRTSTVVTLNAPSSGTNNFLGLGITFGTVKLGTGTAIPATAPSTSGKPTTRIRGAFWLNGNNQTIAQLGIQANSHWYPGLLTSSQNGGGANSTLTLAGTTASPSRSTAPVQNGGGGTCQPYRTGRFAHPLRTEHLHRRDDRRPVVPSVLLRLQRRGARCPRFRGRRLRQPLINGGTVILRRGRPSPPATADSRSGACGAILTSSTLLGNVAFDGTGIGSRIPHQDRPGHAHPSGAQYLPGTTIVNGGVLRINKPRVRDRPGRGGHTQQRRIYPHGHRYRRRIDHDQPNTVLSPGNNTVRHPVQQGRPSSPRGGLPAF